jgi:V8-like Glu-specific endopeptidase
MQKRGTKDAARCAFNDFALVRVDPASVSKVNPTVPVWGGPNAIASTTLKAGTSIYTVGNSSLRTGTAAAKTGSVMRVVGGGLAYDIKTSNPGIPGDSGSGFMDARGRAAGVLSTLSVGIGLTPVSNTMGDLFRELNYAKLYGGISGLYLVKGTRPFAP